MLKLPIRGIFLPCERSPLPLLPGGAQYCWSLLNSSESSLIPSDHWHPILVPAGMTRLISFESVMPSNHVILCRPLLLPLIFPSIRVISNESVLHIRWPKYWSFSFNISPSNEHSGLIFRIEWLDLLAIQGTSKNLFQQHSSKASILQRSAFLMVQLSHPYMTTGKTMSLTRCTFVGKVMFLLFNMLSWLVITFLPRRKLRLTL